MIDDHSIEYSVKTAQNWIFQAAQAVNYLQIRKANKVFYRNINPLNMLLDEKYETLKIFNLNLTIVANDELTKIHEKQVYVAPEIINGGYVSCEKSDTYSLALSLEHCLTREMPFSSCRNDVCFEVCKNSDYYQSKLDFAFPIIESCTLIDPQSRLDTLRMIRFLDTSINIYSNPKNLQVSFLEFQSNFLNIFSFPYFRNIFVRIQQKL